MRVVFVNRGFMAQETGSERNLADLAFFLAKQGLPVTVVAGRQRLAAGDKVFPPAETRHGVSVIRVGGDGVMRSGALGQWLDAIAFHLAIAKELWRSLGPEDVVVPMSDPPLLAVTSALVAARRHAKLVPWLPELFPEAATAMGSKLPGLVNRALALVRDRALRRAAACVVPGAAMQARLVAAGIAAGQVTVIPPWLTPAGKSSAEVDYRAAWEVKQRFTVAYLGDLQRSHEVDTLAEAIERIAVEGDGGVLWVFAGGGTGMRRLRESVPMKALPIVRFLEPLSQAELAAARSVPDVLLVSQLAGLDGLGYPELLPATLAAGKPVLFIGQRDGEVGALLDKEGCGRAVQANDIIGLVALIGRLRGNESMRALMGKQAQALCARTFTRKQALPAWEKLLRQVGATPPPATA